MTEPSSGKDVSCTALQTWMLKVLQRKGMFAAEAEMVVQRLLEAECRGRHAAGVALFPELVSAIDLGDVDPRARTLTVLDLPASAIMDGSTGAGQVGATRAMQLAIQKAHVVGIGMVLVKNSQPCGDVRSYAELAAQAGCLGFCTTNSGKATWPADSPLLGVHPQAWALPVGQTILISQQASGNQQTSDSPDALLRGLLSLALTAGLAGARAPFQKKKLSPYGSGAEHFCLAIDPMVLQAQESLSQMLQEAWTLLPPGASGWESVIPAPWPELLPLPAAVRQAIAEVAQASRVAWTED